jgi:DNA-binding MarR family transcriptional regulator
MMEQELFNLMRENIVLLTSGGQQALEPFNLTMAQYDTLHLLGLEEGQRMGELSGRLLIDNSKMTRIVDYLSEKGWVERRPDSADRRAWCLFLTPEGADQRERATKAHQEFLQEQFAALDRNIQQELSRHLAVLRRHFENN